MSVWRSQRRGNQKRKIADRKYWVNILKQHDEDMFFIYSHAFVEYWSNDFSNYNMIEDVKRRGFIIYCVDDVVRSNTYTLAQRAKPSNEPPNPGLFIEIAFVHKNHRRKHILTQMFRKLQRLFPRKVMTLYSTTLAFPIWTHLGFVPDPFWILDPLQLVRFPGKQGGLV